MFAVIFSGGKQHRVSQGEVVRVEKLAVEPGDDIQFDQVLMVGEGDQVSVGSPYLAEGKVTGKVVAHGRGKKVHILKFKRRKDFMKRQGHRQWYTDVEITEISA